MKFLPVIVFLFLFNPVQAQPVSGQLKLAMDKMEKDEQFAHASIGLYIVNSVTGKVIFDKNAQLGLAPASTQKVVTSAAAYELLGKDFTYTSTLGYEGIIKDEVLNGRLIFTGSGDPTLGSWRWKQTHETAFSEKLAAALKAQNIVSVNGDLLIDESRFESQATPNGWTWDDIGNYYGAGVWGVNWHENSYDLFLKPGLKVGDPVKILSTQPELSVTTLVNELKTGKPGSGDNSIIYLPENAVVGTIRGTIPAAVEKFKVSGSVPDAPLLMATVIEKKLEEANIAFSGRYSTSRIDALNGKPVPVNIIPLVNFVSPPLDSINYWFLRESINLYGEALVKTIAYKKTGLGSGSDGIEGIKELWKSKGIDNAELKMKDGSGLSPANRVTPHALVAVMQYARKQGWFSSFYHSLPLQNNIKMKSGYIGGVRSYTGYVKSKTGEEYTFAFIINNFDGSAGAVREKMWKLLDLLK